MPRRITLYASLAIALLLLGAGLRLFDLTDEPIDFHPTRQLRGEIVARGIYMQIAPGIDAATRRQAQAFWDSVGQYEPSILESLAAVTYLAIGRETFWVGRIYNTLFWLIGGLALLALARSMAAGQIEALPLPQEKIAWIAALAVLAYYLALPFSVQASRSFQPDPGMVMWLALACYCLWRWSTGKSWRWTLAAGLAAGIAVLTKAVIIFTMGGALLGLALYTYRIRAKSWPAAFAGMLLSAQLWMVGVLTVLPTAIYYATRQDRAGQYFSSWTLALSHLLLEPRFYLGWLNLAQELLTPVALLLALLGIWLAHPRARSLLIGLWVGYIAYGLFLPYQMDTHSYYHLQLVLLVALSLLPVAVSVVRFLLRKSFIWQAAATAAALLALVYGSWQALIPLYSQDFHNEPAYWQTIASYLPSGGKIIALTQDYGYRLMYYGSRKVTLWPNRGEIKLSDLRGSTKEFDDYFAKRTQDKSYFLITSFNQYEDQPALQQELKDNYPVLAQGQGYIIFDLTRKIGANP